MERQRFKFLTEKQKDIILALHKSELTSRQIAEVAECAQSTVIRHLQKFQKTGQLPMTERRKTTRYRGASSPKSPEGISLSVNYKYGNKNYGGMSGIMKNTINEQLNYYQKPIARLSYPNMMEVKHSPSSQMDFRSATNGLPNEEEDEEMDTLLDGGGAVKSIPKSSLECGSKPILNGKTKYPGIEDGMEIDLLDDDMDEDLNATVSDTETSEKDEATEKEKGDVDLFDLDLEHDVSEKKITNGETTDSSNVRDAGDDLDTLLSKINDLVEDCMEPSARIDSPTEGSKEVVHLIDDESQDVANNTEEGTKENTSDETQVLELEQEIIEETDSAVIEVETKNGVETSSELKEELKVAFEAEEELIPIEESQVKSIPDFSEDVSQENGVEFTESDFETVEEKIGREVEEEIPEVGAEEIQEIILEEAAEEDIIEEETVEEGITDHAHEGEEVLEKLEKVSQEITTENMDMDDDIVCLDSPMPAERKEEEDSVQHDIEASVPLSQDSMSALQEKREKQMETELTEVPREKVVLEGDLLKEIIAGEIIAKAKNRSLKPRVEVAEIFLIDDDDEPMKEDDSVAKIDRMTEDSENYAIRNDKSTTDDTKLAVEEKLLEEEETLLEEEQLLQDEIKDDSKPTNEEKEKEKKTEVASVEKPLKTKEDDDDIVCLDDSFEETEEPNVEKKIEEKSTEVISQSVADKVVDDADLPAPISEEEKEVDREVEGNPENQVVEKVAEKQAVKESKEEIVPEETKTLDEKLGESHTSSNKSEEVGESLEPAIESAEKSEKVVESLEQKNKPTEEIVKEVSSKISENETSVSKEVPQAASEPEKSSKSKIDNDIINLDDDDEDEAALSTQKKEDKSSEEVLASKSLALLSDNSDNARDGVEEKDEKSEPKVCTAKSTRIPSETNSNSSSNLLKESTVTERDESRSEPSEQPPAKRIRLSQDEASSRNSNASQEDTSSKLLDDDDVMEILDNDEEENKTLKRVHSTESISSDFKKPKTDTESLKVEEGKPPELLEEILPAKVDPVKVEEKFEKKPVEVKPLPLYPPPNFDAPKIGLSLDFLRRFKKSIHKMNKFDLEDLVLQKIVEAIVHKSEFSEMRELIEKQEKIISGHRSKITELNKQFRDLEMVHNRVLKDLETKNSQFIMPVKITRAVGLQVFFPNKKYDQPMASLPAPSPVQTPSSSSLARSVSTSSSTSSIPEKAPISSPTTNNLTPQTPVPTAAVFVNSQPRRGCIQKLTPMRPDGPRSSIPNRGVTAGVVSSSTPSPMTPKDTSPKILNRQITPKPRMPQSPMVVNASNTSQPQQAHNIHPLATPPEPERPKAPLMPPGIATKKTGGTAKNFPPSKRIPKSWQSEQPVPVQSLPTTPSTTSSTMVPPQSSMVNSSLAVKTPSKSVIDLTDEDDVAPTPSPKAATPVSKAPTPNSKAPTPSPKATGGTPTTQKTVNNSGIHRVGPYKVSVIPAAQLQQQQPRPNASKPVQPRPPNLPQLAPKPNGTAQNSVRRTPPPVQQRFRHPAPLPNQPIHSSNPLWKLPPARPTIRISNLDSGIVISWTIEDMAKEKYAESTSYQIYAYQETSGPPLVESWRHVGDVKAMLLPMAVTLTQFQEGQRYYFAVRAVDAHNRCGPFSFAKTWS